MTARWRILHGDCREQLRTLPERSAQTCVTSPPYWGLRDYGCDGQLGLERTPDEYVANLVEVFGEVRRVLRDDGTLWLNLGDSYSSDTKWGGASTGKNETTESGAKRARRWSSGVKPKDLVGVPWRVAFALQADGWYLRSDVIWAKPNPMPESVTDRPTRAHEYLFLMTKSERYHYDAAAIKEPVVEVGRSSGNKERVLADGKAGARPADHLGSGVPWTDDGSGRNRRSVWTVATAPLSEAHFATFPPKLIEPCILAGAPVGGVVLDPFNGAGTTGVVATRLQREYIGIELNAEYVAISERRIVGDAPLFNRVGT